MSQLNLKHLRYFWVVASEGSITRAGEILHLTPQTISGQLRMLEESIDNKLFKKSGRNLVLSDVGQTVFSYADEMFSLESELKDVLEGRPNSKNLKFEVGVAMAVPKLIAYRVLEPVTNMQESVKLVCHEDPLVDLLADLSVHKLDLVLADAPISPALNVKAYNHLLGESGISFFARNEYARKFRRNFLLFLGGVYIAHPDGALRFRWVKAPTGAELAGLTQTLARRIGRFLERQGLLKRDAANSYLAGDDLDAGPMEQLLGSSTTCKDALMSRAQDAQERPTYRIAVGPQQGRKVFTLQTLPAF